MHEEEGRMEHTGMDAASASKRLHAWRSGRGHAGRRRSIRLDALSPAGLQRPACAEYALPVSLSLYACTSELAHRRRRAEWRIGAGASHDFSGRCWCSARHRPLLTKLAADVDGTDERQSAQ